MKYLHNIIIGTFVLSFMGLFGQQDPQYSFYRFNMNLFNPAFAGTGESGELTLGLRSQWAGVEGAPESQNVLFSTPMGNQVGLGVSVLNDRTFIENQTWVALDFSYKVKLNDSYDLFLGLKASGQSYSANTNGLTTFGVGADGSLMDFNSRFTPNVGVGAYLRHANYFLSLSAPKLLTPDRLQERDGEAFMSVDKRHVYLAGGYDFFLSKNLTLETSSMIRYVEASPLALDMTTILDFGRRFRLGASYRWDSAISGLFLFDIGPKFNIGYAYEAAIQNSINAIDNSSHELFMRLRM